MSVFENDFYFEEEINIIFLLIENKLSMGFSVSEIDNTFIIHIKM